jgi:hypothetical protein
MFNWRVSVFHHFSCYCWVWAMSFIQPKKTHSQGIYLSMASCKPSNKWLEVIATIFLSRSRWWRGNQHCITGKFNQILLSRKASNCPQSLTLFHFSSDTENGCKNYWWLLICLQSVKIAFPEVAGHRAPWAASFPKPISLENVHSPPEIKAQAPKHS